MPSLRIPQVQPSFTPRHRIGAATAMLMIGIAGLVDILQFLLDFIPVVGGILSGLISILTIPVMVLWFKICGASFVRSPAGILGMLGGEVFLSFLPLMVARTAYSIWQTHREDTEYNTKMSASMRSSRRNQLLQRRSYDTTYRRGEKFNPQMA